MEIENLKQLISNKTGIESTKISTDSHFEKDLNISRIELGDFLNFLEDHLKISLHREDIVNIETVADLKNIVEDQLDEV